MRQGNPRPMPPPFTPPACAMRSNFVLFSVPSVLTDIFLSCTLPTMKTETALAMTETRPLMATPTTNHAALAGAWAVDLLARAAAGMIATRTAESYPRNVARWLAWMDAEAVLVPTPADVLRYVAALRDEGLKPATVNAHLDAVRGLYRWTETQNLYPAIARSVRGLRVRKDEPLDCLAPEKVAALLRHADRASIRGLRDAALLHVMFSTGLRLVSLCGLDVADLDRADCVLRYAGKGDLDKTRRAYLSAGAVAALARYLKARGRLDAAAPLFAAVGNRCPGARLSARSVRRVITDLMEQAGHVRRDDEGHLTRPGVLSCHSVRRSAITAAYDVAGLDAAQTLAGHADPGTTRRAYARIQKGRVLRDLAGVLDLESVGGAL